MSKKLPEKLKDSVVSDYLSGVTTREIIKKYKTYELYSILNERGIEYNQNNNKQNEKYDRVIKLYLEGKSLSNIEKITGCKNINYVLKKFNIKRTRNPKEYNTNRKEKRNLEIVDLYNAGIDLTIIAKKYNVTRTNIIRILKSNNIEYEPKVNNNGCSGTITQKIKSNPDLKCSFYILEDYYGYTKIGITTKNTINERFKRKVNVFYIFEDTIKKCYEIEYYLKKTLKKYNPKTIDKTIDGWTECYTLSPENVLEYVKTTVKVGATA